MRLPMRCRALLAVAASAVLLSACGGGASRVCVDPREPYLSARDNPLLKTPEGLSEPSRSGALQIPAAGTAGEAATAGGCLDEAPSYFRSSGVMARTPEEVVASWAQAWAAREADGVLALYSSTFAAPTDAGSSRNWLQQRQEQVATGPVPAAQLSELKVEPDGNDRRIVSFVQTFGANALRKELTLVREAGSWRIAAEQVADVR